MDSPPEWAAGWLGADRALRLERLRYVDGVAASLVWLSLRVTHGLNGRVVVVDRAAIVGGLVEIRTERSTAGVSIRWGQSTDGGSVPARD